MGIGKNINTEVKEWTGLAILVIIASIVLIKFKTVGCPSGYIFNTTTSNTCYLSTNTSTTTTTGANIGTIIDAFVTAFSEPSNWVAIVIIAIVGFAILKLYNKRRK